MNTQRRISTIIVSVLLTALLSFAIQSFDLGKYKDKAEDVKKKNPVARARKIKKNLEKDVRLLIGDAKRLAKSKDQLIKLKKTITEEIVRINRELRAVQKRLNSEIQTVEKTLKKTGTDIQTTKKHVAEIDELIKVL